MNHIHLLGAAVLALALLAFNHAYAQIGISGSALFIKPNSVGKIYANFTFPVPNNRTWNLHPGIYPPLGASPAQTSNNNVTIVAEPDQFVLGKKSVAVTYTINAKNNTKGVFALDIYFCGESPLVVGLNESDVSPNIYKKFFTASYSCPAMSDFTPQMRIMGYANIIEKRILVDSHGNVTAQTVKGAFVNDSDLKIGPNYNYSAGPPNPTWLLPSPLEQFHSGVEAPHVMCKPGLQLIFKFEDGLPACVNPSSVAKLVWRGWMISPTVPEILKGPENENTTLQIEGGIFYYRTLNDTMTGSKGNGMQTTFHNVLFTFLPSPWHTAPIGGCAGFAFRSSAKFTDGASEFLRVEVPETECLKNYFQLDMTNHTTPQAGLIVFNDGKIRLLVSVDNLIYPVPGQHPKDADAWLAAHPHFVSCLMWDLNTWLAREVPCAGH